uniref:Uncharacterized protein n=1 Tax=Arundo donax TaxID=35708 RepID=A0A0A8Y415_ARUDO
MHVHSLQQWLEFDRRPWRPSTPSLSFGPILHWSSVKVIGVNLSSGGSFWWRDIMSV